VIQGVVFDDLNGNGTQERNEPGIGGVAVNLSGIATVETLVSGVYRFSGINPGDYTITVTQPDGYSPSTALTQVVGLPAGGARSISFGLQVQGQIRGLVFNDSNGSAVLDRSEFGIGGVVVELRNRTSGQLLATSTSSSDGSYSFEAIDPGAYRLGVVLPAGYTSMAALDVPVDLSVGGSGGANFGLQPANAITGAVFEDLNNNSLHDQGEQGLGGITIQLQGDSSSQSVTTTADGEYSFRDLTSGTYTVTVGTLAGTGYTLSSAETQRSVYLPPGDSGSSGVALFTVLPEASITGVAEPGTILTLNAQSSSSPFAMRQQTTQQVTANSLGIFQITGVTSGNYTIDLTPPPGFTAAQSTISVAFNGESARADTQLLANGVIQGRVFEDLDGSGEANYQESGAGGVTVQLRSGGTLIEEQVTTADGSYRFSGLASAAYTLSVVTGSFVQNEAATLTLTDAQPGANRDLGVGRQGTISGRSIRSSDGSAQVTSASVGLTNFTVILRSAGASERRVLSDGNGFFRFDALPAGSYEVAVEAPTGFFALNGVTTRSVSLDATGTGSGITFAFTTDPTQLINRIYLPLFVKNDDDNMPPPSPPFTGVVEGRVLHQPQPRLGTARV